MTMIDYGNDWKVTALIWSLSKNDYVFWDPSFHTQDNWETYMQLLQKVQTFPEAPEVKTKH